MEYPSFSPFVQVIVFGGLINSLIFGTIVVERRGKTMRFEITQFWHVQIGRRQSWTCGTTSGSSQFFMQLAKNPRRFDRTRVTIFEAGQQPHFLGRT